MQEYNVYQEFNYLLFLWLWWLGLNLNDDGSMCVELALVGISVCNNAVF